MPNNFFQMMQLFQQFRSNPGVFLASRGLNIPEQYMQTPEMAAKYLMQSRGMNQADINNAMTTANQFQMFMNNNQNGGNNNA